MDKFNIEDMKGGWFVGDFEPTAYKTSAAEVSYKFHPKGQKWEIHYHKVATEINYLVYGEMIIGGSKLKGGDVFVLHPGEVADPEFITDCAIVCVKVPGEKNDKYIL